MFYAALRLHKVVITMRIGSINQVAQMYQTQTKAAKPKASFESQMNAYSVSSTGKDYQVAKAAVSESADIREDLVADIKARIKAGTYDVSTDDFAEKLLSNYGSIL